MDEATLSFGEWLAQRRKSQHLDRNDLSLKLNMSSSTLQSIELGRRPATRDNLLSMAKWLRISTPEEVEDFIRRGASGLAPNLPVHPLPAPPNNLPAVTKSFIGRHSVSSQVLTKLRKARTRILTLVGSGGVGKTTLALHIARRALYDFPEGVYFVDLSGILDSALVVPSITRVLGLAESPEQPAIETLRPYLADKRVLLVIDNLEHVLEVRNDLAHLVEHAGGLKILATSRALLHVTSEVVVNVPPLATPPSRLPSLSKLAQIESVELLCDRAEAVVPGFSLAETNAAAVAEICTRVQGVPMAIELCAVRLKLFAPQVLSARLQHALEVLTSGPADLPDRHRTLRSTIKWSYSLLTPSEQAMLRELAVFRGGWRLEAAEQICRTGPKNLTSSPVFEILGSLVDNSLVQRAATFDEDYRFTMLESVREFAYELFEANPERDYILDRHVRFFSQFAAEADSHLRGHEQIFWVKRLDEEYENIRLALAWYLKKNRDTQALALAAHLGKFWRWYGRVREGISLSESVLKAYQGDATVDLGTLLDGLGIMKSMVGDYERAESLVNQSLEVRRTCDDKHGIVDSLFSLGILAHDRMNYTPALSYYDAAIALARTISDAHLLADLLFTKGSVLYDQGDREGGVALYKESLRVCSDVVGTWDMADYHYVFGDVAYDKGEYNEAAEEYRQSLRLYVEAGDTGNCSWSLEGLAAVASALGQHERAARLFGMAEYLQQESGVLRPDDEKKQYEARVERAKAAADIASWDKAWQQGRDMSMDEGVKYALQ